MVKKTNGSKRESLWELWYFHPSPTVAKRDFFSQIPVTDENGQKADLSQANSKQSRLGQLNSRIVLMLPRSTVGSILRETHKPVEAHRISGNNQTFMELLNTKFKNIGNSDSCYVWQGKENSHFQEYTTYKDSCADPGDTTVLSKMISKKLIWIKLASERGTSRALGSISGK